MLHSATIAWMFRIFDPVSAATWLRNYDYAEVSWKQTNGMLPESLWGAALCDVVQTQSDSKMNVDLFPDIYGEYVVHPSYRRLTLDEFPFDLTKNTICGSTEFDPVDPTDCRHTSPFRFSGELLS